MIDLALRCIETELNNYGMLRGLPYTGATQFCELGSISRLDETLDEIKSKVVICLINIEEDKVAKLPDNSYRQNSQVYYENPKIPINVYCLFAAIGAKNRDSYLDSLTAISGVIRFFQGKNVFTPANSPTLDNGIEKLMADLHTASFDQLNLIWGYNGCKYCPSVIYKMRMVVIDDGYQGQAGLITQVDSSVQNA